MFLRSDGRAIAVPIVMDTATFHRRKECHTSRSLHGPLIQCFGELDAKVEGQTLPSPQWEVTQCFSKVVAYRRMKQPPKYTIPPLDEGLSYTQASVGGFQTVILRQDGNVVACGDNEHGQCNIPVLEEGMSYVQVSAGAIHTVLLRSDGM